MGCFVVPVTSAVAAGCVSSLGERFRKSLQRLALCEGVVGACSLAEHVCHGEVTASWPFLTGLATASSRQALFTECVTEGALLALTGVALWLTWSVGLVLYRRHRTALR